MVFFDVCHTVVDVICVFCRFRSGFCEWSCVGSLLVVDLRVAPHDGNKPLEASTPGTQHVRKRVQEEVRFRRGGGIRHDHSPHADTSGCARDDYHVEFSQVELDQIELRETRWRRAHLYEPSRT